MGFFLLYSVKKTSTSDHNSSHTTQTKLYDFYPVLADGLDKVIFIPIPAILQYFDILGEKTWNPSNQSN